MTFRSRMLIAFAAAALVPLTLLTLGVRRELGARVTTEYDARVAAQARVVQNDLTRESLSIATRLAGVARAIGEDNELRAVLRGAGENRAYLLDYATRAMQLTGLSMLQMQDDEGRILSSGHFRNEFDRLDWKLPRVLRSAGDSAVLIKVRAPEGEVLVLARMDSVSVAGRRYTLVGGIAADTFLARAARGDSVGVVWQLSPTATGAANAVTRFVPIRIANVAGDDAGTLAPARLVVAQSLAGLDALRGEVNRLFFAVLAVVVLAVIGLAVWLSARLSRPLADLALATSRIDLEGADIALPTGRDDEIGTVARRLGALTSRLRASAGELRNAERRATVGDMARQVNHDIKNGLIPIRNVLRHLGDVNEKTPAELPSAFAERRGTLDASVEYLDTLARNYARLTPRVTREAMDVNAVIRDVAAAASSADGTLQTRLADSLPAVHGDAVILRRIIDNLLRNALESLDGTKGCVTIATARGESSVIVTVTDTGRGMTPDELSRAFDDFFTTKTHGTGLGLSVVRRLTADLQGAVRVESEPGRGSTFTLELPV